MKLSLEKSQSGNEATSKPDTKQVLAKTNSFKENNLPNITKRKELEELMAKEADPENIPEIEKVNDSIDNTKSPKANKNFFTKGVEIVFNTLDKRLIKPLIKLAQQITGFKSGKEGTSSENVEDPEQAKEIANRELDLSRVKNPKERTRIKVLQKRLRDEGLNAEAKVALVEIIRGAEKTGRVDEKGLPDCCKTQVDAATQKRIEEQVKELLGKGDKSDNSSKHLDTQSSQSLSSSNDPFQSFIETSFSKVRENLSKGNLSKEQETLFCELMDNPKIRQKLETSFRKSDSTTGEIMLQLINKELAEYPDTATLEDYQRFLHDTCIGGVKAQDTSVNMKDANPKEDIKRDHGPEAAQEFEKGNIASLKLRELYKANPGLQKQINQEARKRKETDETFKERLRINDRDIVLLEIALAQLEQSDPTSQKSNRELAEQDDFKNSKDPEIGKEKHDEQVGGIPLTGQFSFIDRKEFHEKNQTYKDFPELPKSWKTEPKQTEPNTSQTAQNHESTSPVSTAADNSAKATKTAANSNNSSAASNESSSQTITEIHEEKQTIRG
ncbi:MAG: hypothetical protein ACKO3R_00790 [bacterium]